MVQNEFTVVLGKKGYGKTVWAKHYAQDKRRLIVYDPKRQFSDDGIVINNFKDFFGYLNRNRSGNFRIIYQPLFEFSEENVLKAEFKRICLPVSCMRNIYFLIDEIHLCTDRQSKKNEWFVNIIDTGRHQGISMLATTLRYTHIDRDITAQADCLILFRTQENSDIRYFRDKIGELAEHLPSLPPYHFIEYEDGEASIHQPIDTGGK